MRRKTNKKRDTVFSKIFKKGNDSTTVFEKLVLGIISLIITFVIVSMVSGFML